MLRRPALPLDALEPTTRDRYPGAQVVADFRSGVRGLGLAVASESLHAQVRDGADEGSVAASTGVALALGRYLARMSTRATPFGAFAGLTTGTFGAGPAAPVVGPTMVGHVRPDTAWLLQYAKAAEERALESWSVPLRVNDLLSFEGPYATLPVLDVHGEGDGRSARMRATEAFDVVLDGARASCTGEEIQARLLQRFPQVDADRARGLVQQMLDVKVLLSELRPSVTADSPARALVEQLRSHASTAPLADALLALLKLTDALRDEPHPERFVAGLAAARAAQATMVPDYDGPTLQVDSVLADPSPRLPRAVGREIAASTDALLRLQAATRDQQPHLTRYRRLFEKRYGVGVHVPVQQVISAAAGIDAPETYSHPVRAWGLDDAYPTLRDEMNPTLRALCSFAAEALQSGAEEVELTDQWLERLAPGRPGGSPFPVVDVYVDLHARDRDALDSGDWRVVMKSHGVALGGRTFGRFAALLDDERRAALLELAREEERARPEAVFAEVTYMPQFGRGGNVLTRPLVRAYELPVNVAPSAPPDRRLELGDVMLGSNGERLYLWSSTLDRELVVTQNHMLTLDGAPNVCRLLLEVSQQGFTVPRGFDWGPMSSAPRLPRVVRHRTVLRVGQWNIPKTVVAGRTTDAERQTSVRRWLQEHSVPERVHLAEHDNRIVLALDSEFGLTTLVSALLRCPRHVTLEEELPGPGSRWLEDTEGHAYAAELVVPVVTRTPEAEPVRTPLVTSGAGRDTVERFPPSSEWSYVQLFVPSEDQDAVVADVLEPFAASLLEQGVARDWFYIRYADPDPDLRIRFRATPGHASDLTLGVLEWAREQVEQHVARDVRIETYVRETARYGGPEMIETVERLFTRNSVVSAGILRARADGTVTGDLLLTVVAACDALMNQWGLTAPEKLDLVPRVQETDRAREVLRAGRPLLRAILGDAHGDAEHTQEAQALAAIVEQQHAAVADVARRARELEAAGRLVGRPGEIVQALCHMQVNRLMMSGGADEADCYSVWRRGLLALAGAQARAPRAVADGPR